MINNKVFDDITKSITRLLPEGAAKLQDDFEANIRAALQAGLAKMNLVTREEFDIQSALLQRTREKLEKIEQQLEAITAGSHSASTDSNK